MRGSAWSYFFHPRRTGEWDRGETRTTCKPILQMMQNSCLAHISEGLQSKQLIEPQNLSFLFPFPPEETHWHPQSSIATKNADEVNGFQSTEKILAGLSDPIKELASFPPVLINGQVNHVWHHLLCIIKSVDKRAGGRPGGQSCLNQVSHDPDLYLFI